MKHNDTQLGIPETIYKGTKADIEAAFNLPGMVAYATDTELYGYRDTSAWVWGTGSSITVSDTTSIDLTLTGGVLSGVVLPAGVDHGGLGGLADNDHPQYLLQALATTTSHYTGFPNRTDTALSWVDGVSGATRTLTLGGTNFDVYIDGLKYTIATDMTKQIADVTGLYWFWIELVAGTPTLQAQVGAPGFGKCLVATVYWNTTTDKSILSDERHWMGRDKWMHEYLHETVGARYYEGLTGTFGNTTFSVTAGEFYDEDIEHALSSDNPMEYPGTAMTTCKVLYHNGDANWAWDAASTTPYKITTGNLRYNSGNTLATAGANKFINYWIFATAGVTEPIWAVVGTAEYNNIADARAASVPSLGQLPSAEVKLIYRVTYKNDGTPTYQEAADYRASQVLGSTFVPTNHAVLSNLSFATSGHTGFQAEITAQAANAFLIGPASGADAVPTFRAVVNADLAASAGAGSILFAGASAPAWAAKMLYTDTGYLEITTAATSGNRGISLISTSNAATTFGTNYYKDRSTGRTAAANDNIGSFAGAFYNDAATPALKTGWYIQGFVNSSASGAEAARLVFANIVSGTAAERMRISEAGNILIGDTTDTSTARLKVKGGDITTDGGISVGSLTADATAKCILLATVAATTVEGEMWFDSGQKLVGAYTNGMAHRFTSTLCTMYTSSSAANPTTATTVAGGTKIGTLTLPANFFVVGKAIRLLAFGTVLGKQSDTFNAQVYLGATAVADTALALVVSNATHNWVYEAMIICRTSGSAGTVVDGARSQFSQASNVSKSSDTATTINTTSSLAVDLMVNFTTGSAGQTAKCAFLTLEVLN